MGRHQQQVHVGSGQANGQGRGACRLEEGGGLMAVVVEVVVVGEMGLSKAHGRPGGI